jgi:hypothetical protein
VLFAAGCLQTRLRPAAVARRARASSVAHIRNVLPARTAVELLDERGAGVAPVDQQRLHTRPLQALEAIREIAVSADEQRYDAASCPPCSRPGLLVRHPVRLPLNGEVGCALLRTHLCLGPFKVAQVLSALLRERLARVLPHVAHEERAPGSDLSEAVTAGALENLLLQPRIDVSVDSTSAQTRSPKWTILDVPPNVNG